MDGREGRALSHVPGPPFAEQEIDGEVLAEPVSELGRQSVSLGGVGWAGDEDVFRGLSHAAVEARVVGA